MLPPIDPIGIRPSHLHGLQRHHRWGKPQYSLMALKCEGQNVRHGRVSSLFKPEEHPAMFALVNEMGQQLDSN
jgi:hypothetical protein